MHRDGIAVGCKPKPVQDPIQCWLSWNKGSWDATLYGTRYGKTPSYAAEYSGSYSAPGAGTVAPWMIYNASIGY